MDVTRSEISKLNRKKKSFCFSEIDSVMILSSAAPHYLLALRVNETSARLPGEGGVHFELVFPQPQLELEFPLRNSHLEVSFDDGIEFRNI